MGAIPARLGTRARADGRRLGPAWQYRGARAIEREAPARLLGHRPRRLPPHRAVLRWTGKLGSRPFLCGGLCPDHRWRVRGRRHRGKAARRIPPRGLRRAGKILARAGALPARVFHLARGHPTARGILRKVFPIHGGAANPVPPLARDPGGRDERGFALLLPYRPQARFRLPRAGGAPARERPRIGISRRRPRPLRPRPRPRAGPPAHPTRKHDGVSGATGRNREHRRPAQYSQYKGQRHSCRWRLACHGQECPCSSDARATAIFRKPDSIGRSA